MKKTTYNNWVKITLLSIGIFCIIGLMSLPLTNPIVSDIIDTVGGLVFLNFCFNFIAVVYFWANPNKLSDTDTEIEQELETRRMHTIRNNPAHDEDYRRY